MKKMFEKKLEGIHENGHAKREESSNISEIAESTLEELSMYESFIPEFFCEYGNEDKIRKIYRTLKEGDYDESSTAEIVDLYESDRIYKEYYEGMAEFVKDVIAERNSDLTQESVSDKNWENLNKAKSADSGFVKSIFGGDYNKREQMVMTEAVKNLEFLIDFIPTIGEMKKSSMVLSDAANTIKGELATESVKLLCDSVCNYCYESIATTMDTYELIDQTLYPAPEQTVTYTFKMFGGK